MPAFELENRAQNILRGLLDPVPFARLEDPSLDATRVGEAGLLAREVQREGSARADFESVVTVDGREYCLVIAVKASGEPRHAREAVRNLNERLERHHANPAARAYAVFIAPYISSRSAKICREAGVGYIDFAGNCLLAFANVYIERTGNPNPHARRRPLRSIYSPKAERVLRTLLNQPHRRWRDRELAEAAQVSIGHVSNVKHQLAAQEWIRTDRVGWTVTEPEQMLSEWKTNYRPGRNERYPFYSLHDVAETEHNLSAELEAKRIDFAFTAFSAAARYAPFVRYDRIVLYVASVEETQFESVKPVTSGANVELVVPRDEGVLLDARERHDLRVVGPVQTFLDLTDAGVRSEEAQEAMLDYIREHSWTQVDDAHE